MSRLWQTLALLQFVSVLLNDGVWRWICAALLAFDLVQLWLACRREAAMDRSVVLVVQGGTQ